MSDKKNIAVTDADVRRVAAAVENMVWADRDESKAVLEKLAARKFAVNVRCLVRMLKKENDQATVNASFALEGLIMEAGNPDGSISSKKLGEALAAALPDAGDEYALCLVLEEIRRLAAGDVLQELEPYLMHADPVFTYAVMAVEAMVAWVEPEAIVETLMTAADATKDKKAKIRLHGAALRIASLMDPEDVYELLDDVDAFKVGRLDSKSQDAIMMLEELSRNPGMLDTDVVWKALDSKSALVRGLAQRVIFLALVNGDYAGAEAFYDIFDRCSGRLSVSLLKSMYILYLCDTCCLGDDIAEKLEKALADGDIVLKKAALNLISKTNPTTVGTEQLVARAMKCGKKDNALRVLYLNCFADRLDKCAAVYVMTQLKSEDEEVREAARKAAFALGIDAGTVEIVEGNR